MDVDEALLLAGGDWGWYQRLIYVLVFISAIPNAFTFMHFVYSNFAPIHRCKLPEVLLNYSTNNSVEYGMMIDYVIPKEQNANGEVVRSQCKIYARNYSEFLVNEWPTHVNDSVPNVTCPNGWSYDSESYHTTAAMEMSMVCDDDWKGPLVVTVFMAGVATCSLSGALSDKFGRRPVFLAACAVQVASMGFTVLVQDFYAYAVLSFFTGMSSLLNYVIGFVIATEMTPESVRNFMAISGFISYGVGYCIVAGMAYAFQNWRLNIGMMTLFSAIMYLPNVWLLPESVRWLTQKGKQKQALKLLKKIAKTNGRTEQFKSLLEDKESGLVLKDVGESSGIVKTISVLFKSGIAKRCLAVMMCWFTTSLVYFAISFYSTTFSTDRYLNVLYGGLAEFPAYLIVYHTLNYIGRPRTIFILLTICGCSSITLCFLPKDMQLALTIISMSGKGAVSAGFYVDYMMAAEVVPTLERGSFMSLCSFVARIGAFISPFLMHLAKVNSAIPNMTMGVMAIVSGIAALLWIPETKLLPMPDTVVEVTDNRRFYGLNICKTFEKPNKGDYTKGKEIELNLMNA